MSDVAIRVEGLGKRYRLGAKQESYHSLRDSLAGLGKRFLPSGKTARAERKPEFWALKDLTFEVKHGDVLGIVGRNGAGKSTLLKLLSEITEPTVGRITMNGRVASLLEVGTGFHPELSGRENIFLNGAILGMTRAEIGRKFDEIVAFAEVDQFIDTQVKHYSSGMYLRLAFAVAAHLEQDTLIVDEVLAVGDVGFQRKCLGKMGEVARGGRTVLFVSHNMAAVENLCTRGIVLQRGHVDFIGTQQEAVTHYLGMAEQHHSLRSRVDRSGTGEVRITAIEIRDTRGNPLEVVASGMDIDVYLHFENTSTRPLRRVIASIQARNHMEIPVFLQHNRMTGDDLGELSAEGSIVCRLSNIPLPASIYKLDVSLLAENGHGGYIDSIDNAAELNVVDGDYFGTGEVPPNTHGLCLVPARWRLEHVQVQIG